MPRSISFIPTSANIVYTAEQAAVGAIEVANSANFNKYLKNVDGTLTWISLPPLPAYDPKGDSTRLYIYEFSTFNYNAGVIREAGGRSGFDCATTYGTMTLTDSNRALSITNNSGGAFKIPLGKPSAYSLNWSVTYLINSKLILGGQPQNTNVQLITGNGFVNNFIYDLSSNTANSYYVVDNDGGLPNAYQTYLITTGGINSILPQNQVSILTYANIDGYMLIYLNGVQMVNVAFANVLSSLQDVYFSGAGGASSNANQFCGLTYGICALQNATLARVQKVEGYFRHDSRYSDLSLHLDASHPYYAVQPTI